ncbi:Aste57867_23325 [Aphanomyces stellatus]|uniref:Aste57867_23325 protein n=1 Tax=Aphanomyces stellatus TaxID=120398 RepID=A0A485LMH6_9STRA|nr:hypothetical protein As57867_023254 [Aphanomyces stellatus]VFT99970.1 Aste57867_23325 [Aphanomyces stellatus]
MMARRSLAIHTPVRVTWSRLSLFWSVCFVLNLTAMPLKAYFSETFPWHVPPLAPDFSLTPNDVATLESLQSLAQSQPHDTGFARDASAYVLWYPIELPAQSIPDDVGCMHWMLAFPAAALYGPGLRQFVCAYLARNASMRAAMPSTTNNSTFFRCQVGLVVGVPSMKFCLWLAPVPVNAAGITTRVIVAFGGTTYEPPAFAYLKFAARLYLCGFIARSVWATYFVHYNTLRSNLQATSPPLSTYARFDIHVGDPTYLVLSHPWVTLFLLVEIYSDVAYQGLSSVRCSQLQDLWQFALGCLYGSRGVWFGYWAMRYSTFLVKRWHWEDAFAAVDPGLLATASAFYAGPIFYAMSNIGPFVHLLQTLFSSNQNDTALEIFPVWLCLFITIGSMPLVYSVGRKWLLRRRPRVRPAGSDTYGHASFNDLKMRVLHGCLVRSYARSTEHNTVPVEGGTLYRLYDIHPGYKKLPLISHRGADCFVDCYLPDGTLGKKMRLSLLGCLDRQDRDPKWALDLCESCQRSATAAHVGSISSITHGDQLRDPEKTEAFKVHMGANGCSWVL